MLPLSDTDGGQSGCPLIYHSDVAREDVVTLCAQKMQIKLNSFHKVTTNGVHPLVSDDSSPSLLLQVHVFLIFAL